MKTLPSEKETVLSLFEYMVLQFEGEKHPNVNATYQFVFTDIDNGFPVSLRFSGGKAEFREGLIENPNVTIRTPSDIWLEISGGFRNPVWALITKKFTIKGNLTHLRILPKLLTKKIDVPRSPTFSDRWTQPENILVLVGNPRKKNGLTSFYLQQFLAGIKSTGVSVEEIHLYDKEIKPCLGCFHCWTKTPGLCVQKDDQKELLDKLDHADLIVYALPLYYHSVPGKVKNHLDRQIPRMQPFFEKAGKLTRHPRRAPRKQS
ncbi:MAG: NAD(P)H-dependent oxidoreductase, partial [bacterium]